MRNPAAFDPPVLDALPVQFAGRFTRQFVEDAGPLAHPVRPRLYHEINNFYTTTVYEKGAEVVRMLQTLLGPETFRKGMDLYFERHDGQAVTCDDFVAAVADANGRDLMQFRRWYSQAGTPVVAVSPIVGGTALKGPADRMLVSLGHESSARGVARLLAGHIDIA